MKLMRIKVKDEDGCWSVLDIYILLCDWSHQVFKKKYEKPLSTRAVIFNTFSFYSVQEDCNSCV